MQIAHPMQQIPKLHYNDLEAARLDTCIARGALFAAQRTALSLLERENDEAIAALVQGAKARIAAEDQAAAEAKAKQAAEAAGGNVEVIELRPAAA